jgi:hypothetical protein
LRIGTLILAAAAAAGLLAASPSHAGFPAPQGRLLLMTESSGGISLELRGPGDKVFPLSVGLGVGGSAAMSADGSSIALNFGAPFDPEDPQEPLVVTDFFGLAGGTIANGAAGGGRPSWSPDGQRIAFALKRNGNWDIFVSATGDTPALTNLTNSPGDDRNPRWSPDGKTIAFESNRDGNSEIYAMEPDGSHQVDLTNDPGADTLGDWSPDSKWIVFSSTRTGGGDLYVMPASGAAPRRLTSGPGTDTHAAWSPDGGTIAYSNDADGDSDVFEIAPAGTGLRRITDNDYVDLVEDWQPLLDAIPPRVKAVASRGLRRRPVKLRFKVWEDSRRAVVSIDFSYRTRNGFVFGETGRYLPGLTSGRTYSVAFPARYFKSAPTSFRFCVLAFDPTLNQSERSCARYRFLTPKKKR